MSDKQYELKYEKSYVAFLDVLGFKNLVFSNSEESKEKLNEYFKSIETIITYLRQIPIKKEIGYITISDSIILTVPQSNNKSENIEILRQLCIAIGFLQAGLAARDIWIRGAVSSGDTYFNTSNNQIVGPAYINAYLLEESLAIYPRVIIDNKIIKELDFVSSSDLIDNINKKNEGYLDFNNCGKTILYDWENSQIEKDIPLFIDYLSYCVHYKINLNTFNLGVKILDNIERNIYNSTSLYKKFKWVSNYFNSIIENKDEVNLKVHLERIKNL